MTDRELLELAAKAAGYKVMWVDSHDVGLMDEYIVPLPKGAQHFRFTVYPHNRWNPFTDDGDALRLAVKLELEISRGDDEGACVIVGYYHSADINYLYEQEGNDPYAATRRAIVRAAAAIGKAMP